MKGDVVFKDDSALFKEIVEVFPCLSEGFGHCSVNFCSGPLSGNQLVGLFQQLLHWTLLALRVYLMHIQGPLLMKFYK